jgi:hypothetical protein
MGQRGVIIVWVGYKKLQYPVLLCKIDSFEEANLSCSHEKAFFKGEFYRIKQRNLNISSKGGL